MTRLLPATQAPLLTMQAWGGAMSDVGKYSMTDRQAGHSLRADHSRPAAEPDRGDHASRGHLDGAGHLDLLGFEVISADSGRAIGDYRTLMVRG